MDPTKKLALLAAGISASSSGGAHQSTVGSLSPHSIKAFETFTKFLRQEIQNFVSARYDGQTTFPDWLPGITPTSDENDVVNTIAAVGSEGMKFVAVSSRPVLDKIYLELVGLGKVSNAPEHRGDIIQLLFFFLGCLTMLYRPKISHERPINLTLIMEGYDCFEKDSLPINNVTKRPITENIHGFGLNLFLDHTDVQVDIHESRKSLDSRLLNADVICNVAAISIEWTTCIFSHLSFSDSKRCLSLFALPSFCLLHSGPDTSLLMSLYSSLNGDETHADKVASTETLQRLLKEVLLSYHLLFGNHSRSRKVFGRVKGRCKTAIGLLDPLLVDLCTQTSSPVLDHSKIGKSSYSGSGDFPNLYDRLSIIQDFVSMEGPKNPIHIWRDRRDLNMAYTFRAVIIFGLVGVLLSVTQTVLAGLQYRVGTLQLEASCPCGT